MMEKPDLLLCSRLWGRVGRPEAILSLSLWKPWLQRCAGHFFNLVSTEVPRVRLPWVSLISLDKSLKFYWRYWDIFFFPPWHSGTQRMWKDHLPFPSNVSNPINTPAPLQSPVLPLQSLQWTPEFTSLPFPSKLSLPFISESILIYSGFEKERFEEQVLNASKSIIFLGKIVNSIPRLRDKTDTTGEVP